MKTSKLLIFPFLAILFFLASCSDDPTKQEVFEEFVKEQLPGQGKDLRVQNFILKHYNFLNEEELFNGDDYDTNHVCLFIKDGNEFIYSFRLVSETGSDGIDNYIGGYKVYNTIGGLSEDELKPFQKNFRKLAYFLYDKNAELLKDKPQQEILNKVDLEVYKQDLKQRLVIANANLKRLGLEEVVISNILSKVKISKNKKEIVIRLKNNSDVKIFAFPSKNVFELLSQEDIAYFQSQHSSDVEIIFLESSDFKNYKIKTEFFEKCHGVESDNCGLPHITNLFIKFKGVYYGIDKWNEIL